MTISRPPAGDLAAQLRGLISAPPDAGVETKVTRRARSSEVPLSDFYANDKSERPGEYPYTRGRSDRGYLDEFWVMGQYSGFASPKKTNERFKELIAAGQTGLSVALDLPTQMGYDSDAPLATGEVGKVGVPLDTVDDLLLLLDGVPLGQVRQIRTTANAIGPIFAAMFLEALDELAVEPDSFRLIVQNDPLKEYIARGTYIFPPAAGLKLAVDVIEYFAAEVPNWEPIEFCGYHIRDAGGTAVHEVAIATANGIAYLDAAVARGVDIETITHSLYLFLSAGIDIFEEAAKLRAARRIWAKLLVERYAVPEDRAAINLFVYTLGGALTAQEPLNNVVRITCEALAAVLGGAQTLATSSYDEALGLPTPEAARLALRTQQVIAHESGAAQVVDPMGGSFYLEELTDQIEAQIVEQAAAIAEWGGAADAIASGHLHRLLADSAYEHQTAVEDGRLKVVGVNIHETDERAGLRNVFKIDPAIELAQNASVAQRRADRSADRVERALADITRAAHDDSNVIPAIRAAAKERATLGEITTALEATFGRFRPMHTF
jgi:methylmalonyl-CoA mutase N-terminal domain/subunit